MLEKLNNDCWLEIIKYLSLKDQIALYEAFKGISSNFMYHVVFAWEHQRCFSLDPDCYAKFKEMPELLDIFLSSIKATQEMQFHWVTLEFLKLWENYTFPSIKRLEYTLDEDLSNINEGDADEALTIMTKIFPGLQSVLPTGDFDCSTLVKLTQLRKLDLSEWTPFCRPYHCIDELTKCPLIEELRLKYYEHFTDSYEALMAMPKMHTVSFYMYYPNDILASILSKRLLDVHKITFSHCIYMFRMPNLHKLKNLLQLTLLYEISFPCEKLIEMIANFKELEQLDLICCEMMLNEAELWQTVDCCPSLRILNIYNMHLKEDFFDGNRCVMEKTLSNRSQDLTLNCDTTREIEMLMRQLFKHPRLKLSFVPLPHELDGGRIKVHFEPLLPS
ncbi:uncharacterized protein LOC133837054 isoform X1 [Drosophila sulfurigaster albostrigata]|uniref:uncharacterized protein LOC133837054 isoform X1 n=1 Tax=Drosophila sulfurigaster albostrigata TaxID=89887 RepID=UPI002D218D53|nr:uncharacterized protein LOC133837054 isoform X1 [Drosophila sulfurigaster albostrigata]